MTGARIDRKFLVQPDRWSLLSSTALRTVSYLYMYMYIYIYTCTRVYTWPCKKVWRQKLPWPLGFYGDWSDRTGARSLRVYTRVRGSIIPSSVCVRPGIWRAKSFSGAKKSKRARSVCNARLPPATTKGRNVADSWTNERPEIFVDKRRERTGSFRPTFLSSTVCYLSEEAHTHTHTHTGRRLVSRAAFLCSLDFHCNRLPLVSITLKTFDSIM